MGKEKLKNSRSLKNKEKIQSFIPVRTFEHCKNKRRGNLLIQAIEIEFFFLYSPIRSRETEREKKLSEGGRNKGMKM